jgi:putative spermidine/putrescine transport system permease protein
LYLHPKLLLVLLLAPPLLWLGVIYLGSLFALLLQSFFYIDDFSGNIVREFSLATYEQLFTRANADIFIRTTLMAAAVTAAAALIAFPIAYYMVRCPLKMGACTRDAAVVSYLVRVCVETDPRGRAWSPGWPQLHLAWLLNGAGGR